MKKSFLKIATLILSAVIAVSVFTGCDKLVKKNTDKDMGQVIATVSINVEGAPKRDLLKREFVSLYLNYGYYYAQQLGSVSAAADYIFEMLVNNVLLVQTAMYEFSQKPEYAGLTPDQKFVVDSYLDEEEAAKALYNANKAINDLIDSYKDEEDEVEETYDGDIRTVPTGATNYEAEHEGFDTWLEFYNDYNTKGFLSKGVITGFDDDFQTTDLDTKKAYNKIMNSLENTGLLGSDFDTETGSIYDTDYYARTLVSEKEAVLLEKYMTEKQYEVLKTLSYEDLEARYEEMYLSQVNNTPEEFVSLLSSASKDSPVLYASTSGYGYVYNLLIGVDSVQEAEISEINNDSTLSKAEKAQKRAEVLAAVTAKDLRDTWIKAGYDFDGTYFTGDYSIATKDNALRFFGKTVAINDEEEKTKYEVVKTDRFSLDEFIAVLDAHLFSEEESKEELPSNDYYRVVKANLLCDEFDNKVADLLFAFSTDPGSLNTYKGYTVSPEPNPAASETYVKEFANAAREVLGMPKGSYIVVGTDFGYHVIINSLALTADYHYATLDEYLDSLGVDKEGYATWKDYYEEMIKDTEKYAEDHDTNFFLYAFHQAFVSQTLSNELNKIQMDIIYSYKEKSGDSYVYKKDNVTTYKERLSEYFNSK